MSSMTTFPIECLRARVSFHQEEENKATSKELILIQVVGRNELYCGPKNGLG